MSLICGAAHESNSSSDLHLVIIVLMENLSKTKCSDSSFWNTVFRTKSYSYTESSKKSNEETRTALQEFNVEISTTFQKKLTSESLSAYVRQLVSQVYEADPLGTGKVIG